MTDSLLESFSSGDLRNSIFFFFAKDILTSTTFWWMSARFELHCLKDGVQCNIASVQLNNENNQ